MDFEKYKIFDYTKNKLEEKYSKDTLDKYFKIIAFLYQNGYDLNCKENEIEEQLLEWNYFKDYSDFENLISIIPRSKNFDIGREIVSQELSFILKEASFARQETDNPEVIKIYTISNWKKIIDLTNKLSDLFFTDDYEINGFLGEDKKNIKQKIDDVLDSIEKDLKVITWRRFNNLLTVAYSTFIKSCKQKIENRFPVISNINDELYGIGGYNPNTKEIKCMAGSMIYNTKACYNSTSVVKIKMLANTILKENKDCEIDDYLLYLNDWMKGKNNNNEKAKQIVVNNCLLGIFNLLMLKHNINFYSFGKKMETSYINFMDEIKSIISYCGVPKEYLL